jgi:hypothetical protein
MDFPISSWFSFSFFFLTLIHKQETRGMAWLVGATPSPSFTIHFVCQQNLGTTWCINKKHEGWHGLLVLLPLPPSLFTLFATKSWHHMMYDSYKSLTKFIFRIYLALNPPFPLVVQRLMIKFLYNSNHNKIKSEPPS